VNQARDLRRRMRAARRTHADRTIWRQLEDAYVWVFGILLVGAMAGSAARQLNLQVADCSSLGCSVVGERLWPILLLLLVATALRVLLAVGPVVASNATGFWLLASPVDRSALLRPAYGAVLAGGVALGAIGAVAGMALPGLWSLQTIAFGAVFLAAVLTCTVCVAVLAQVSERRTTWLLRFADALLVVTAVLAGLLTRRVRELTSDRGVEVLSMSAPSGWQPDRPGVSEDVVGFLAVALLTSLFLVVVAGRSLRRLRTARVVAGGDLVAGLAGAAASLDVGLLADVVATRRWRQVARVRFWPGRFAGSLAIVQREACRVLRWPRRLVFGGALLIVPYSVASLGGLDLVLLIAAGACLVATRPLVEGLRTVSRSPGLARALPLSPRGVRIAYAVVPGGFALLWSLLAAPAFADVAGAGVAVVQAGVVAAAVLAGVVRHGSAPRPSYDGPLLATPIGAVPPGLMSQPLRGLDATVVSLLPALLGVPPAIALAAALAVLALVLVVPPPRS
jgi:Family of unknown function (DUF6297)